MDLSAFFKTEDIRRVDIVSRTIRGWPGYVSECVLDVTMLDGTVVERRINFDTYGMATAVFEAFIVALNRALDTAHQ